MFSNIYVSTNNVFFCFLSFQGLVHNCNRIRRIGPTVEHGRDEAADVDVWAEVDEGEEQDLFRGSSNIKDCEHLVFRLIRRKGWGMFKYEM